MKTMKEVIEKCPKTLKDYKKFLIKKYNKNYDNEIPSSVLKNGITIQYISSFPMGMVRYFDSIGEIGTITHDGSSFCPVLNGSSFKIPNDSGIEEFKTRPEAEEFLIKYLCVEREKTL